MRIETKDGNEYIGQMMGQDSVKIYLKTQNLGEIGIPKSEVKYWEPIHAQQIKEGKLWFTNPQSTRYFWSPNGYGLKKGEGYYQNIWVLWNQVGYGVTENFSIGGGIIPLFFFGGASTPVFLTPKVSFPLDKDKINIGGGALLGTVLGEEDASWGILYGIGTLGSPDNNITLGVGYGYAGGDWASRPLITLSGMVRLSNRGYFLTENFYISDGSGESIIIMSLGGRWIIKKAGLDFGLFIPVGEVGDFIAVPWLGFTVPFGKQ